MMVTDGRITLTDAEFLKFQQLLTWVSWRPRTPDEFNAMCDLAMARHRADNTAGLGEMYAQAIGSMRFGPEGEINFPEDRRRLAYAAAHGTWPTNEQLEAFEAGTMPKRTGPVLVPN
jgi:hypothetical protein